MFLVVRPIAHRLAEAVRRRSPRTTPLPGRSRRCSFSALIAEQIGIHAIFGAFLFGAILPADSPIARQAAASADAGRHDPLPAGVLRADRAAHRDRARLAWQDWGICLLIIALATAGKFGGTFAGRALMGMPALCRAARILMNTRGLMELVVLNVGLDLGVISPPLFTMMVIMALVTTAMTAPLLDLIAEDRGEQ